MQAYGPGLARLRSEFLKMDRAQPASQQDQFLSMLQRRLVARICKNKGLNTAKPQESPLTVSTQAATGPQETARSGSMHSGRVQGTGKSRGLGVHPAQNRNSGATATPTGTIVAHKQGSRAEGKTPASPPDFQPMAQSAEDRVQARSVDRRTATSHRKPQGKEAGQATAPAPTELPPALVQLMSLIDNAPNGVLKWSATRQPEIIGLLLNSGLPAEQVEQLLASPRVQEQGLSSADVLACWQNARQPQGLSGQNSTGPNAAPPEAGTLKITTDPEYQRRFDRLSLPASSLSDLKAELLRAGVPPELLAGLEKEDSRQGISLKEVWQLLRQAPETAPGGKNAAVPASAGQPDLPQPSLMGDELKQWRQLLLQAGFKPEEVQTLLGSKTPANPEELRQQLLTLAPPTPAPQVQEAPKPLYLPENLRFHALNWQDEQDQASQQGMEQQQGEAQGFGRAANSQGAANPLAQRIDRAETLSEPKAVASGNQAADETPQNTGSTQLSAENGSTPASPATSVAAPGTSTLVSHPALANAEVRQGVWTQIQSGVISNLRPGETQVNLTLQPSELGQVQLTLSLKGQNLEITALTSRSEVAQLANAEVQQLVQALTQHGLTLTQFQVQVKEVPSVFSGLREEGKPQGESKDKPGTASHRPRKTVDRFA